MQNDFTPLLTSLLCLLPLCLGGLAMMGVGVLMVRIFVRARRPKDAAALAADRDKLQAEVEALMPQVHPWQPEALADLRTYRRFRWFGFGRNFRMRGLIAASRSNAERTWAAFALRGRRIYRGPFSFHGQALVRTAAQSFEFHARPSGEVIIQVDGSPLGSFHSDGRLVDTAGQHIGTLARASEEHPTRPVTLHGRVVAHLAKPVYKGLFRRGPQPLPPAVEIVASHIGPDETNWVLALALWHLVNRAAIEADSSGV